MSTVLGRFEKQTAEVLDYYVLFADWFSNRSDAAQSIAVTADAGITVAASSLTGTTAKVVLSGGTSGMRYKITVRLTTTATPAIVKEVDFTVTVKDV